LPPLLSTLDQVRLEVRSMPSTVRVYTPHLELSLEDSGAEEHNFEERAGRYYLDEFGRGTPRLSTHWVKILVIDRFPGQNFHVTVKVLGAFDRRGGLNRLGCETDVLGGINESVVLNRIDLLGEQDDTSRASVTYRHTRNTGTGSGSPYVVGVLVCNDDFARPGLVLVDGEYVEAVIPPDRPEDTEEVVLQVSAVDDRSGERLSTGTVSFFIRRHGYEALSVQVLTDDREYVYPGVPVEVGVEMNAPAFSTAFLTLFAENGHGVRAEFRAIIPAWSTTGLGIVRVPAPGTWTLGAEQPGEFFDGVGVLELAADFRTDRFIAEREPLPPAPYYLKDANAFAGAGFGFAVALSSDTLAVGSPVAGRVHIYRRDAEQSWVLEQRLFSGGGDRFGERVELDPTIVRGRELAQGLREREKLFHGPIAVEVDDAGRVFVVECSRQRLQVFRKQSALYHGGPL